MSPSLQAPVTPPVGTVYYVSPAGSDLNPGTLAAPWRSLGYAQSAVRALLPRQLGPITVVLRGGSYVLSSTLAFGSADGGSHWPVIWQAMPGEQAALSGGSVLTNPWSLHDAGKNIWVSNVASGIDFRQVYVNDQRVTRAVTSCPSLGSPNATGYSTSALSGYAVPADLEIVYRAVWAEQRLPVASVSGGTVTMVQPAWSTFLANVTWGGGATPAYLENAYEILAANAAPGTFYHDKANNLLYLIPPAGVSLSTATSIVPHLSQILTVTASCNLTFLGLTFAHSSWLQAQSGYGYVEMGDTSYFDAATDTYHRVWTLPPAAVSVSASTGIEFDDCAFWHVGATAVTMTGSSASCAVRRCVLTDCSGIGAQIGDMTEYTSNPGTNHCTVENNDVSAIGLEYRGAPGIMVNYGQYNVVRHNRVRNVPYNGIFNGGGQGVTNATVYAGNNELSYNDIGPCMQTMADGAALYTNGLQNGTTIHHNVLHEIGHGGGVYCDDGTMGVTAHDNYVWSSTGPVILINDNIGNSSFTTTYADSTTVQISAGPENGEYGASATTVASVISTSTASVQALAVMAGCGVQPTQAPMALPWT